METKTYIKGHEFSRRINNKNGQGYAWGITKFITIMTQSFQDQRKKWKTVQRLSKLKMRQTRKIRNRPRKFAGFTKARSASMSIPTYLPTPLPTIIIPPPAHHKHTLPSRYIWIRACKPPVADKRFTADEVPVKEDKIFARPVLWITELSR
jgi:hypothetical protein